MKLAIFGATGEVGRECLSQALEAGHSVRVLVRTPSKLPAEIRDRIEVVEGDGLVEEDVARTLAGGDGGGVDAVLFAIGIDKNSPEDLCTISTRHIFSGMSAQGIRRFVWCGGGSTLTSRDQLSFGARFVEFFARTFMGLRHRDKAHQLEFLESRKDIDWVGVRPLQIRKGERLGVYRLGYDRFSGMSQISFADVGHAMLAQLESDTWLHAAPILQY